ncbi:MAG: winged helix-turn-helix domain-containing protein [Bacteroidaceae bacterium]|nr:winged helix-turn-helix domain-containing protein [Bacteroidaceae bacterium]
MYVSNSDDTEDCNEVGGQKGGQKSGQKDTGKTIDTILQLIKDNPSITRKVLSETLGISTSAIQKHIDRLKAEGIIVRNGGDRGGSWEVRTIVSDKNVK